MGCITFDSAAFDLVSNIHAHTLMGHYNLLQIWKDIKLRQDRRRQSINASTTIRHQARRRQEDNLAVVFMGIVGAFLLCHLLRIALRYLRRILSLNKF